MERKGEEEREEGKREMHTVGVIHTHSAPREKRKGKRKICINWASLSVLREVKVKKKEKKSTGGEKEKRERGEPLYLPSLVGVGGEREKGEGKRETFLPLLVTTTGGRGRGKGDRGLSFSSDMVALEEKKKGKKRRPETAPLLLSTRKQRGGFRRPIINSK